MDLQKMVDNQIVVAREKRMKTKKSKGPTGCSKRKYDKNNNLIYYVSDTGVKVWMKYDKNNNEISIKTNKDFKESAEYDENNNQIHKVNCDGSWSSRKYNERNEVIYSEDCAYIGGRISKDWYKYDDDGNQIYTRCSSGSEIKRKFNSNNELTDTKIFMDGQEIWKEKLCWCETRQSGRVIMGTFLFIPSPSPVTGTSL